MNLVFNLGKTVNRFTLSELACMVKDAGFDAVDFDLDAPAGFGMTDPQSLLLAKDGFAVADKIKKELSENGCPINQTHAPFGFKDYADPIAFESFIYPAIVRSIEISAALGAKTIIVHPLHYGQYFGYEQQWFEKNMEFYRSLIPVCKANNIKVCLENMFQRDKRRGTITHDTCSSPEEFCRYVDALDSEYMVACLDIGHVGLVPHQVEAWDFIWILGHERLQALHIHDNDYRNDNHALPYTGLIDWAQVTRALGEIDYSGDFTYEVNVSKFVENMEDELVPAAFAYMGKVGKHLVCMVDRNRPQRT